MLRCLQGTPEFGIRFVKGGDPMISGLNDADWLQERPSQKSLSGFVVMVAGSAVSLRSKQQFIVSQSSKESEYVALVMCVCEMLWLKKCRGLMEKVLGPKLLGR